MRRKIKAPHYATLLEDCLRNVMPKNHGNGITVQHGFQSRKEYFLLGVARKQFAPSARAN